MNSSTLLSDYIIAGFEKIDRDLQELMSCFREILEELGEGRVAAALPWIETNANIRSLTLEDQQIEQAYSIAFQLLNIVEARAAAKTRRLRELELGIAAERGLWGYQLSLLKKEGYSPEKIAASLSTISIEPVFTAHPTEAKRGAVLEQHRILYHLLTTADEKKQTPSEQKKTRRQIKISLEKLWRSGEIFFNQPNVADERRDILFYLRDILPHAVTHLDERLLAAWEEINFSPALISDPSKKPEISFGTWVGGDRDGHPFVTADVTKETLSELRLNALLVIYRHLGELARSLPLSSHFQKPSEELLNLISNLTKELGSQGEAITQRYKEEPWRQLVLLLQAKLPLYIRIGERASLDFSSHRFSYPEELKKNLSLLERSLKEVGADRLIRNSLCPIFRLLDVFGFHLAKLDIRQNSSFHDQAMVEILRAAAVVDADSFGTWDEERRLKFLRHALSEHDSLLKNHNNLGDKARAVLSCYQILRDHRSHYGPAALGSLIVSMTRKLSDLLVVAFLAREGGITHWNGNSHTSLLPIVPLFETREDLQAAPALIEQYLQEPALKHINICDEGSTAATQSYATSVEPLANDQMRFKLADVDVGKGARSAPEEHINICDEGSTAATQSYATSVEFKPHLEIMIGYSDSNKDCGIMASQWALQEAQQKLSEVAKKFKTSLHFFHGRGGTISRGAGPTHLFLEALPAGSLHGSLKMTEQGETIAQKYADDETATYHLELLQAGVAGVSLRSDLKKETTPELKEVASFLAEESRVIYQCLLHKEGFMTFYEQATPIDALEASRIGSRPKRRSNQRTLADLRAIPWVFSWNQSRYFFPGWFGVGSALEALEQKKPELFNKLIKNYRQWPFMNYVLSNVETNLASADLSIMKDYAELVSDKKLKDDFFSKIAEEFNKTEEQLQKVFGGNFATRRPRMAKTLQLRNRALLALHQQQILILKAWREAQQEDPIKAESLLPSVLLSVNAIASGLRTTG